MILTGLGKVPIGAIAATEDGSLSVTYVNNLHSSSLMALQTTEIYLFLNYVHACLPECMYDMRRPAAGVGQEMASDPLDLEL